MLALPEDLLDINLRYPPRPPNNGKYRLRGYVYGATEHGPEVVLAPTDYFSTHPVISRMFEPILLGEDGQACSPSEKYGKRALVFEDCLLPSQVCLHVIVLLSDGKVVLGQRKKNATDWLGGKWAPSFEETMASQDRPGTDTNFFDTVERGLMEELGTTCDRHDIKILSLVMDTVALAVDVIAVVPVADNFATVHGHWQMSSEDGKAELARVLDVEWSLERLVPVLCGEDLVIDDVTIRCDDWHLSARMRIAVGLFHTFGTQRTLQAVRDRVAQRFLTRRFRDHKNS
jgi:hypothetical protein